MTETSLRATRTIDAPAHALFAVLADPDRHAELDGSDMVRGAVRAEPITAVGQRFRTRVHHPRAGDYETDNHVSRFEPDRVVAWMTSAVDAEPAGWEWVWRFEPLGPDSTEVSVTYDWSGVPDPAVLARLPFPVVPVEALERTLAALADLSRPARP